MLPSPSYPVVPSEIVATNAAIRLKHENGDHASKDEVNSAETPDNSTEALFDSSGGFESAELAASSRGVDAYYRRSMGVAGSDVLSVEDLEVDRPDYASTGSWDGDRAGSIMCMSTHNFKCICLVYACVYIDCLQTY